MRSNPDGGHEVKLLSEIQQLKIWKRKSFWLLSAVALLLALPCVYKIVEPDSQYRYEGAYAFEQGVEAKDTVIMAGIALPPGVYTVELEYSTDTDYMNLCTLQDGTVFYGGLKTNGEQLCSGLNRTSFGMWLLEGTEQLQVLVSYGGEGSLQTSAVTFRETNQLWTSMLVMILFFYGLLLSGLVFYCYDREYGVAIERKNAFFWVMLIGFMASVPFFFHGNAAGGDLAYHLNRIEGIKDGILSGQFPTRIEPEWVQGYGYANAIFYCPTLLLFPALLRLAGFTVAMSYQIYCITLNFAMAWIAYYCFRRIFQSRPIGILCSAMYTLSLVHIYAALVKAAVGEASAMLFLPLVLYGLFRIFTEDPKGRTYKTAWIPVAAGYAGIVQTHVLTGEITVFLTMIVCILCIKRVFRKETFLELAKGAGVALGVSLWYLVPFLDYYLTQDVHVRHVSGRTIQERGLYPAHLLHNFWQFGGNAILGEEGMRHSNPYGVGLLLVTALVLFVILWFSGRLPRKNTPLLKLAKLSAVLGSILMFMSLNIFPWDRIQKINGITASLVSSLQFPNRVLGWATLCLVVVCGYCMKLLHKRGKQLCYYGGMIAILLGITTSSIYFTDYATRDQQKVTIYNREGMGTGYISGEEYLIEGTDQSLLVFKEGTAGSGVEIADYQKQYLHVQLTCTNGTAEESYVELPLLYYKGYRAIATEDKTAMEIGPGDNNVVRVVIPAGFSGEISVNFVSPFYWRISECISLGVLVLLLILYVRKLRKRRMATYETDAQ